MTSRDIYEGYVSGFGQLPQTSIPSGSSITRTTRSVPMRSTSQSFHYVHPTSPSQTTIEPISQQQVSSLPGYVQAYQTGGTQGVITYLQETARTSPVSQTTLDIPPKPISFVLPISVPQTSAYKTYGYIPDDPTYQNLYGNIESSKEKLRTNWQTNLSNIYNVLRSPTGTTFSFGDETYTKLGMLSKTVSNIPVLISSQVGISRFERTVKKYEKGGFYVDVTPKGVSFHEPSAQEVSHWYFGEGLSTSRAIAGSAMELGIPAFISGAVGLVTGDPRYWETEVERQYSKTLKLSMKPKETPSGYTQRFWTSWEAAESVYIPLATIGLGQVYTGIRAGATGTVQTGRLAAFGTKHGTKIVKTMDKTLLGAGLVGSGIAGYSIGTSFAYEHKGLVPVGTGVTTVGKVISGFTLAGAGFKTGEFTYQAKHGLFVPKKISAKLDKDYLVSSRNVYVEQVKGLDRYHLFATDKSPFGQIGQQGKIIGTSKLSGISKTISDKLSVSRVSGSVEYSWSRLGTKYTRTRFHIAPYSYSMKMGKPVTVVTDKFLGDVIYGGKSIGRLSTPTVHKYQKYFDFTKWIVEGTGKETIVGGYSFMRSTGKSFTFSLKESGMMQVFKPTGKGFTDVKVVGETPYTAIKPMGKFMEFESGSLGKYWGGGKEIGYGFDLSKVYYRDISGMGDIGSVGARIATGGGTQLGGSVMFSTPPSVTVSPPKTISPITKFLSTPKTFIGTSSTIMGFTSTGLINIPKTVTTIPPVSIHKPKMIQVLKPVSEINIDSMQKSIQKVSTIQIPSIRYKSDIMQKPVLLSQYHMDTKLASQMLLKQDMLQKPISIQKMETLQSPMMQSKLMQQQAQILKMETVQAPVVTPTVVPPPPTIIVPPTFIPPPIPLPTSGGRGMGSYRGGWLGKKYKFRKFRVVDLFKDIKLGFGGI